MTWEEKFAAITALCGGIGPCLRMRRPGNWYVSEVGAEIGGDGMLTSPTEASSSPQAAVEDKWRSLTELPPGRYLVLHAMDDAKRRHVRWNGYMWAELLKETP